MQLTHRFTLPASVEQAWTAFYFPNRIAPCFPGATLNQVAGNEFDGVVKIKLGPMPMQYEGTATFLERSPENQRIIVEAHGEDRRGHGKIMATVSMTFTQIESATEVEVISEVELTGQTGSFGQTVVQEASDRLVQRLVDCVSGKFAEGLGDLPTADELAMNTPAEQADTAEATAGATSKVMEPPEAAQQADTTEPTADATSKVAEPPEAASQAVTSEEPTAEVTREVAAVEPTADVGAEDGDVAAEKAAARGPEDATAEPGANGRTGEPAPNRSAALSTTERSQAGTLATVVMPRVRRFGPPVVGALVVVSAISGILRRIRR